MWSQKISQNLVIIFNAAFALKNAVSIKCHTFLKDKSDN